MADFNTLTKEQAEANRLFATANIGLNRVDTYGPAGSINWTLRPGADPSNPQVGDYVQTTTLSPSQQAQFDSRNNIQESLLGIAQARLGDIGNTYGQGIDVSGLRSYGAPVRTANRPNLPMQSMPSPVAYRAPQTQPGPVFGGTMPMQRPTGVRSPTDPSTYRAMPVAPAPVAAPNIPSYAAPGLGGNGYTGGAGASVGQSDSSANQGIGLGYTGGFDSTGLMSAAPAGLAAVTGLLSANPVAAIANSFQAARAYRRARDEAAKAAAASNAVSNAANASYSSAQDSQDAYGAMGDGGFGYGGGWGDAGDGGYGVSSGGVGGGGYADGSGPGYGFGRGRGGNGGGYGNGGGGGGYGGFGGGYGNGGGGM